MTCSEVFENMDKKFKEFNLKDVYGVFQFDIRGAGGGYWYAVCSGDSCRVSNGQTMNPDVVVTTNSENAVKLAMGKMNPLIALATRKVKVKGNMALAAKVKGLLSKIKL